MTNKATKRALFASLMALLLCFTMMLGTTFAWFTDSATSSGNKIVSGTLTIDLQVLDEGNGNWYSIKETPAPIFNYEYWEPGYVQLKVLKVVNTGTLAIKWKAALKTSADLNILADVIDVYVKEDVTAYTGITRELEGFTKMCTLREFIENIETTTVGTILPNDTKDAFESIAIAFKMQETAGNEYQGLSLGAFDITILATQLAAEEDSFGSDYDENAEFATETTATVTTSAESTTADPTGSETVNP